MESAPWRRNQGGGIMEEESCRRHPGDTQETSRKHPGDPRGTQETPRSSQEAPKRHPGGTQRHPEALRRHPGGSESENLENYYFCILFARNLTNGQTNCAYTQGF